MPHIGIPFYLAIVLRTVIVLISLVIGLRALGKRQMGQFNIYDLALIMLLANAVQNAMTNGDGHILTGLVSAGALFVMGWVVSRAFINLPGLQQHVTGGSTLLVNNGQMIKERMRRERVTQDQLLAAMRQHGLCDFNQVRMAVLEVDGTISIVPNSAPYHETRKKAKRSRRQ